MYILFPLLLKTMVNILTERKNILGEHGRYSVNQLVSIVLKRLSHEIAWLNVVHMIEKDRCSLILNLLFLLKKKYCIDLNDCGKKDGCSFHFIQTSNRKCSAIGKKLLQASKYTRAIQRESPLHLAIDRGVLSTVRSFAK